MKTILEILQGTVPDVEQCFPMSAKNFVQSVHPSANVSRPGEYIEGFHGYIPPGHYTFWYGYSRYNHQFFHAKEEDELWETAAKEILRRHL